MESYPSPPPGWGWLPSTSTVLSWLDTLVLLAAVAQVLFVILWATLPWWREWIGRALMVKSVALMLFLVYAAITRHAPDLAWWRPYASLALFSLIMVGILSQAVALPYEIVHARRGSRKVRGTAPRRDDTPATADEQDSPAVR